MNQHQENNKSTCSHAIRCRLHRYVLAATGAASSCAGHNVIKRMTTYRSLRYHSLRDTSGTDGVRGDGTARAALRKYKHRASGSGSHAGGVKPTQQEAAEVSAGNSVRLQRGGADGSPWWMWMDWQWLSWRFTDFASDVQPLPHRSSTPLLASPPSKRISASDVVTRNGSRGEKRGGPIVKIWSLGPGSEQHRRRQSERLRTMGSKVRPVIHLACAFMVPSAVPLAGSHSTTWPRRSPLANRVPSGLQALKNSHSERIDVSK